MSTQSRRSAHRSTFPAWGAVAPPAGVIAGLLLGGGVGAYFGIPGIGAAIGAAVGISAGMALLAAAVVSASMRSGK